MSWRASVASLIDALRKNPRVEIRAFHLFPPAASTTGVAAALVDLYRETDGLQIAWVDRSDADYDPGEPRYEDTPAPWELAQSASARAWTGALWVPPAAALAGGRLDTWGEGIALEGDLARLPDGTRADAAEVLRHLLRWWGSVRHRFGPITAGARVPIAEVLAEPPPPEPDVSLVVHVVEVRRLATEDATWAWMDRGLDPEAIAAVWADGRGRAPAEVVEVELEIDDLPHALLPGAGAPELVAQLLGPWGYPDKFTLAVDLTERPSWVIAFGAAPAGPFDEATAEATEDTEIQVLDAPLAPPSPPSDVSPDRPGFQFAVSVRPPGLACRPRVSPAPVHLIAGRSWRPYPAGAIHELAASPDGKLLAAIAESGHIRLWAVADGSEVPLEAQREPESYSELGFGRDGRLAVWDGSLVTRWEPDGSAAGFVHTPMAGLEGFEASDGRFALWTDRPVLLDLRGDHHGTIDAIDDDPVSRSGLSPEGNRLVVGTEGGRIAAFNLEDFERLWCVATDLGEIRALATGPRGAPIAAGGRDAVIVLDAAGSELRRLPAHDGAVSALAWLHQGRFLASAGQDRVLRLWCARSGALLHEQVFAAPIHALATATGWLAVATSDRVELFALQVGS